MATYQVNKKGGTFRISLDAITVGANTFVVPAGFKIDSIFYKKIGTVAGTIKIGSAGDSGLDNIVESVALSTDNGALIKPTIVTDIFSLTADTTCTATIATGGTLDLFIVMQKVN